MGSKAAMVVFTGESLKGALHASVEIDQLKSQHLAEQLLGAPLYSLGLLPLDLAVWPDVGVACAASLHGFEVVCSRKLARNSSSELTEQISRLAAGRNAYGVFMHSAELGRVCNLVGWQTSSVIQCESGCGGHRGCR